MKLLKTSFYTNLSSNKVRIKKIENAWWAGKIVAKYTVPKIFSASDAWKYTTYLGWLQVLSLFFLLWFGGGTFNILQNFYSPLFFNFIVPINIFHFAQLQFHSNG